MQPRLGLGDRDESKSSHVRREPHLVVVDVLAEGSCRRGTTIGLMPGVEAVEDRSGTPVTHDGDRRFP